MLPPKELQGRFKAAAWQRREDLEAFVAEAEGTPGRELTYTICVGG